MLNLGTINSVVPDLTDNEFITAYTDQDQAFNTVLEIRDIIKHCSDPKVAVEVFANDPTFYALFCKEGDPLQNLDTYIEASMEGKLQDFLRFGLAGLVAGAYYSSLSRIRTICNKYRDSDDATVEDKPSLYLPKYDIFDDIIKKIDMLYDAVVTFQKDPKADVGKVITKLKQGGAQVSYGGNVEDLVHTDWRAVIGTFFGGTIYGFLGALIGAPGGPAGAIFGASMYGAAGGSIGAHLASKNGGPIKSRGWNLEKITKACDIITTRIDRAIMLKDAKPAAKPDDPELGAKVNFVANVYKVYLDVIKNVGRGVASAFTVIR